MRQAAPYLPEGFAFAGLTWARGQGAPQFACLTAPRINAGAESYWRAASISKVVVGQTVRAVVGQAPPYTDVSDLLGWPLRHPAYPQEPITLAQLASHTAGLSDAAGYVVPEGVPVADWVAEQGAACFGPTRPGARFTYSNLGYLLMACVAEAVAGERFDVLSERHVLGPLGIEAGFNWSGLGAKARAARLPTFRQDGARFVAQIDDVVAHEGISGPDGASWAHDYVLGRDVARLSPQGGLRVSLAGALRLAEGVRQMDVDALAGPATTEVDPLGGVFESYGWGVQVFETPSFYPRPLVGHFANAYGFAGGVWYDRQADVAFAMALNGLPMGDEDDGFRPAELALFQVVSELV